MQIQSDAETPLDHIALLVRERRASLAALARAEGIRPEDAVDCVQEGITTLLLSARRGELPTERDEWPAMLARIVQNAARNRRRRHHLARPHEDIDNVPLLAATFPADDLLARGEEHVRLRLCVEELCEIQKAVITLRMLEEQPGEDVARTLGISPGYVAVLLHRAKESLRTCLIAGETVPE